MPHDDVLGIGIALMGGDRAWFVLRDEPSAASQVQVQGFDERRQLIDDPRCRIALMVCHSPRGGPL